MRAVLLIDDHAMFREGLVLALTQAAPDFTVHAVSNGSEAIAKLEAHSGISVVMMDYYLPDVGGSVLLRRLRQARPGIHILVLSASEDPDDVHAALSAGAQGFIHKSASSKTLLEALNGVIEGKQIVPDTYAAIETNGRRLSQSDDAALLSALTPRQIEVLRLVCDGLRNSEISTLLGTSEKTVKAHMTAILAGLGVINRTQAVLIARRAGLFGKPT
ncbi:bacterial regulatory s, luxR family protein [Paraburkholderia fungorum]|uniref:Bacterial regulatory s, luxR family protein n=1 Tax=Paraburkholderia fungorum TaxID=134537 RepID=A0AAU8SUT4_9BURK|nr:response regulator transcription factor [Paraburkholderia fungorum]AJZ57572.1 bacterial regulatory s, luxR family protein [Paraburkholderia fungorum]